MILSTKVICIYAAIPQSEKPHNEDQDFSD